MKCLLLPLLLGVGVLVLLLSVQQSDGFIDNSFYAYIQSVAGTAAADAIKRPSTTQSFGGGNHIAGQTTDHRPVLYVHGLGSLADVFSPARAFMLANGYGMEELYATTYGTLNFQADSMKCAYVQQVRNMIKYVHNFTNSLVDVISHSMGGPLSQKAVLGGFCVDSTTTDLGPPLTNIVANFITLAGANRGTSACDDPDAQRFVAACRKQTKTGLYCTSAFLADIQNANNPPRYQAANKIYSLLSMDDQFVFPNLQVSTCNTQKLAATIDGEDEFFGFCCYTHDEVRDSTLQLQYDLLQPSDNGVATTTTTTTPTTPTTTTCAPSSPSLCDAGWSYFNGYCYLADLTQGAGIDQHNSEVQCQGYGAHLASVHSQAESDFINQVIQATVNDPAQNPSNSLFVFWNGYQLNYIEATGVLVSTEWKDGSPVNYANVQSPGFTPGTVPWGTGAPDSTYQGENCTVINGYGQIGRWNDVNCIATLISGQAFTVPMCKKTTLQLCTDASWTTYGGNCYKVFVPSSPIAQSAAENACVGLGAHLVSIRSSGEQAFVSDLLTNAGVTSLANPFAWDGMTVVHPSSSSLQVTSVGWTDGGGAGPYGDPTGAQFQLGTFPWCSSEPSNSAGDENCVIMDAGVDNNGCWRDITCTDPIPAYVCKMLTN